MIAGESAAKLFWWNLRPDFQFEEPPQADAPIVSGNAAGETGPAFLQRFSNRISLGLAGKTRDLVDQSFNFRVLDVQA